MSEKKGPTRAQLQSKIERLERQLAYYQQPEELRQKGEHWYEVVEFFDAKRIRRIGDLPGMFLMGRLRGVIVLQVPRDANPMATQRFVDQLKAGGIDSPVLVISEDVRFLKLATVDEAMEKKLDETERARQREAEEELKREREESKQADERAVSAVDGSEPDGDGLGGGGPGEVAGGRGGGAPDEKGEVVGPDDSRAG